MSILCQRSLDFAKQPSCWPCRPFLPLTHAFKTDTDGTALLGLLVECEGLVRPVVYLKNMFDPSELASCPQEAYASLEHLFTEWLVD